MPKYIELTELTELRYLLLTLDKDKAVAEWYHAGDISQSNLNIG